MTYQQAITTLNFNQSIDREVARKLAVALYSTVVMSTALKTKVAIKVVAFGA